MALNPLTGAANSTVKIGDYNAFIAALNVELAALVAPIGPSVPFTPEPLPKPGGLDPDTPELVYDKATIYLGDMELYVLRIGDNKWRLVAQLNYILISAAEWTYDEIVEGTADEVYNHALARLRELAELKSVHNRVHDRVRRMSEGEE